MNKREKLIARFNSNPKDFTFEELETLMGYFGYKLDNAGKTSGSRVRFIKDGKESYLTHKPHSYKYLHDCYIKNLKEFTLMRLSMPRPIIYP